MAFLALFLSSRSTYGGDASASTLVIKTHSGEVRGKLDGKVREFFGIPFAAPPVGPLRWRPPQPHAPWTTALDATRPGSSCAQTSFRGRGVAGSEDCLFLNIYAPDSPDRGFPVMTWIHGGTFLVGSGTQYDGSRLAAKGHLIVVTINYRLGPFGFLVNRSLETEGVSGNYGLLDQQAGLRLVKENIEAFGGDPSKVTAAGESAGAISVGLHLVSPAAAGMFARAILESGPFLRLRSLKDAEQHGDEFAAKLGCTTEPDLVACMRSRTTEQVLNAIPSSPIAVGQPVWVPVMDGHLIPSQPSEAIAAGRLNKVPVINGANHDEGTLFLAFAKPLSQQDFVGGVQSRFGGNAGRVLAAYPLASYASPTQASAAGFGDVVFSCPILRAGGLLSEHVPVYEYEFNDPHAPNVFFPNPPFPFGAYHGAEIQYVFGTLLTRSDSLSMAQRALADTMMDYWIDFISSGEPGGHSPRWELYRRDNPRILSFSPGAVRYESDFSAIHHCDLWDSLSP